MHFWGHKDLARAARSVPQKCIYARPYLGLWCRSVVSLEKFGFILLERPIQQALTNIIHRMYDEIFIVDRR